jgi:Alpha/beta hydrolase domain
VRGGYAWVGVSAQHIGIEGGPVAVEAPGAELMGAGQGLRTFDADRYGELRHPGDAYSYDLYTQVARALRSTGGEGAMGELDVQRLLAVGESQSAFALTTYANGVQPLTEAFDGFLIHSRGGAAAPLGEPDAGIDISGTLGGPPTRVRTDLDVPTMIVQTETEVLGLLAYLPARQDDTDRIRLWEVAGTAHADAYQVGVAEDLLGCAAPLNEGQQRFVLRAALRHLDAWASGGEAPPEADRLDVDESGAAPTFGLDDVGNVTGGVRTPVVDAPVDVLSGLPVEGATIICVLMGSTTPIPPDELAARWEDRAAYEAAYAQATDDAIDAGFILEEDREAVAADASTDRPPA